MTQDKKNPKKSKKLPDAFNTRANFCSMIEFFLVLF